MGGNLLLLEGPDDTSVLYHLLRRHNIPTAAPKTFLQNAITLESGNGIKRLQENVRERLKLQDDDAPVSRLGVIVDADTNIQERWQTFRSILRNAGYLSVPMEPHPNGTIIIEPHLSIVVGLWIMPDNQLTGAIERFVQFMLPEDDLFWEHAGNALTSIPENQRLFPQQDTLKAHMHTWLAWQKEPGAPMGQAINYRYLNSHVPQALLFIDWIRRLFALDVP